MEFMVLDENGEFVTSDSTPEGAREAARDWAGAEGQLVDETGGATSKSIPRENPYEQRGQVPHIALTPEDDAPRGRGRVQFRGYDTFKRAGIPAVSYEEVEALTSNWTDMRPVYDRLYPWIGGTKAGSTFADFKDWSNMLRPNYKMAKGGPKYQRDQSRVLGPNETFAEPGTVVGLSLLPYWSAQAFAYAIMRDHPGEMPDVYLGAKAPKELPAPEEFEVWRKQVDQKIGQRTKYLAKLRAAEDDLARVQGLVASGDLPPTALEAAQKRFEETKKPKIPGQDPRGVQTGLISLRRIVKQRAFFHNFRSVQEQIASTPWNARWAMTENGMWPLETSVCQASTLACRCACLVLTGQQVGAIGVKLAFTMALYQDPVAFCAWLAWCCRNFFASTDDVNAFVRLNVFSDLCWEIICPWLWRVCKPGSNVVSRGPLVRNGGREAGAAEFYDYTAISPLGRKVPDNYDLTMSFKGTNWDECEDAVNAGYRAAVVLVMTNVKQGMGPKSRLKGLPGRFRGHEVVDGDADDMRPLDPSGTVAFLRYKAPKLVHPVYKSYQRYRSGFIVPVQKIEEDGKDVYISVATPRHTQRFEDFGELGVRAQEKFDAYAKAHAVEYGAPGETDDLDRVGLEETAGDFDPGDLEG